MSVLECMTEGRRHTEEHSGLSVQLAAALYGIALYAALCVGPLCVPLSVPPAPLNRREWCW